MQEMQRDDLPTLIRIKNIQEEEARKDKNYFLEIVRVMKMLKSEDGHQLHLKR